MGGVDQMVLKIPYRIKMVNSDTGEIRILRDSYGWKGFQPDPAGEWKGDLQFFWSEGNQACDENRVLDWYRLAGEAVPKEVYDVHDCTTEKFCVPYLILDDGERIWIDDSPKEML